MKRSAQVALVLMSAATVGGAAYSMMPRQSCAPAPNASPNAVTPNRAGQPCTTSRASTTWFRGGRPLFGLWNNSGSGGRANFSSSDSGTSTSTTTTSRTATGGTQRGGFGGTSSSMASRGG